MAFVSRRTEQSPRFVSDTLVFYEKDVFDVAFTFELDRGGEPVEIGPNDTIRFIFYRDGRLPELVEVEVPGAEAEDNVVFLRFTPELTGKFERGRYEYRIQYVHESGAVTVAAHGNMIVE